MLWSPLCTSATSLEADGKIEQRPNLLNEKSEVSRAGIADVVRRPIASAELAAALSSCLRSAATPQM